MSATPATRGFTLVEALTVVVLIGIVAVATVPVLRSDAPARLDAAALEVGNVLRFALSEANRTGAHVLVDASAAGHLRLHASNAAGAILGPVNDPMTKTAMDFDTAAPPWSARVGLKPRFRNGGAEYSQLLVGPGAQLQAFDAGVNRGALQTGSGVVLTSGLLSATVAINETSGRVTLP